MNEQECRAFLARLWECQGRAAWNDAELARRLGLSQSYISRLKRKDRGSALSLNFARRAIAVFPDLGCLLPA